MTLSIRTQAQSVRAASIESIPVAERVEVLAEVARLASAPDAVMTETLAESSGLSVPMVRWALQTTFASVTASELERAYHASRLDQALARPVSLHAALLSGNVLTAPARPILLSLLFGVPVLARVSRRERRFAGFLAETVVDVAPRLARGIGLVDCAPESAAFDALLAEADVVSVYGSDATVREVLVRAPGGTLVVPHGHGLGVAYVPRIANRSEDEAEEVAERAALDISAYDQRGCLSPHVVYVEEGGRLEPQRFGEHLHHALGRLSRALPRGPLPDAVASAQLQFRGVGAALGRLFEGDGWSVTYEGELPVRPTPGYRNIAVHSVSDVSVLFDLLAPLGRHLKVVGHAGDADARRVFAEALPVGLAPCVAALGEMQTPAFIAPWDGFPPWHGLVRYASA